MINYKDFVEITFAIKKDDFECVTNADEEKKRSESIFLNASFSESRRMHNVNKLSKGKRERTER